MYAHICQIVIVCTCTVFDLNEGVFCNLFLLIYILKPNVLRHSPNIRIVALRRNLQRCSDRYWPTDHLFPARLAYTRKGSQPVCKLPEL